MTPGTLPNNQICSEDEKGDLLQLKAFKGVRFEP